MQVLLVVRSVMPFLPAAGALGLEVAEKDLLVAMRDGKAPAEGPATPLIAVLPLRIVVAARKALAQIVQISKPAATASTPKVDASAEEEVGKAPAASASTAAVDGATGADEATTGAGAGAKPMDQGPDSASTGAQAASSSNAQTTEALSEIDVSALHKPTIQVSWEGGGVGGERADHGA